MPSHHPHAVSPSPPPPIPRVLCALILTIALASTSAFAQDPPFDPPPPDPALTPMRESIRAQIQDMRANILNEILALDATTAASLDRLLRAHDLRVHDARASLRLAMRSLRDATSPHAPPPDDATLSALIDNILNARAHLHATEALIITEVRPLLSPKQQAELVLFLPAFERQVRSLIRHARRGGGGPPPDPNHRPRRPKNRP